MFSFDTTVGGPVVVTINKTGYSVPRFLLPALKQWAAQRRATVVAEATAHLDPDEKARFLMYFQPPPVDIFGIDEWSRSPEGAEVIIRQQFKLAGVPEQLTELVITNGDPLILSQLAYTLASSSRALKQVSGDEGKGDKDPLAEQPPVASGSASIGTLNSGNSSTPSPA